MSGVLGEWSIPEHLDMWDNSHKHILGNCRHSVHAKISAPMFVDHSYDHLLDG